MLLQHWSLGPFLQTHWQSLLQAQLSPHFWAEHWQSVEESRTIVNYTACCCVVPLTCSTTLANHLVCIYFSTFTWLRRTDIHLFACCLAIQLMTQSGNSPTFIPTSIASNSNECKIAQIQNKFVCLTQLITSCASLGRVVRNLSDDRPGNSFCARDCSPTRCTRTPHQLISCPRCVYVAYTPRIVTQPTAQKHTIKSMKSAGSYPAGFFTINKRLSCSKTNLNAHIGCKNALRLNSFQKKPSVNAIKISHVES